MQRYCSLILAFVLGGLSASMVRAGEFKLANGSTIRGELANADEDGLVVKLDVGGFSKREPWINFSQETLRALAQSPETAPLVEPFIELPPEAIKAREKEKEIVVKPVPNRMERPADKASLLAAFLTPMGLTLILVIVFGSAYAGYEVALYRQQSVPLVSALSLLFPVIVPAIFLCLPARQAQVEAPAADDQAEPVGGSPASVTAGKPASGLAIAAGKAEGASGHIQPQTFTRGEYTFNRRFFETKFAGFFRLVPGEAEKDLVIVIKAVRQEYVAKRITRIASNEMHVQTLSGGEVMVSFAEISTVIVRHKDAKS